MKLSSIRFIGVATLVCVATTQITDAIVMRSDVVEQNYIDLAQPYNSVGRASGVGSGTGFLASPTKFITAGHVVDGNQDGIVDTGITFRARFGTDTSGFDDVFTASSVDVFSSYATSSRYDIAVFTFSTPITGYTPMTISSADPFGQVATMVGYGISGSADTFDYPDNYTFDSTRRAAQNIIDTEDSRYYLTDFDSHLENTSSYGTAVPLALEGTSARGDSGGPLIVGGAVIGIVQGGYSNPYGGESEYGDKATWVRLNDPAIMEYLQDEHGITVVPEASVVAFVLTGLFIFTRRRRSYC